MGGVKANNVQGVQITIVEETLYPRALLDISRVRYPTSLRDEVTDLMHALARLAKVRSSHGRRRIKATVRHAARQLLSRVETMYPVERKVPLRRRRLSYNLKISRLRDAGWVPDHSMPGHSTEDLLGRAASLGVRPTYVTDRESGGDTLWLPRWLDADVSMSVLRRMKRDARFRRAKLAELFCRKEGT